MAGKIDVIIIGGGMITKNLLLPSIYIKVLKKACNKILS